MSLPPQKHTQALVTLLIGAKFQTRWEKLCRENWENYARRCECDLIILSEPLDSSPRAQGRSPAWQKCLVPELKALAGYRQIAWVDSDIFFNPCTTANLFAGVPEPLVGAVSSFADPNEEDAAEIFRRMATLLDPERDPQKPGTSPEDVYRNYGPGLEALPKVFNSGVLVLSPHHHAELFRHVYDHYEDRGNPSYFENVPLSYELVRRDWVHWMDPKFNHLWAWSKHLNYPFMYDWRPRSIRDKMLRRLAKWIGNDYEHRVAVACATSALLNCHLLHFAGEAKEMEWVDMKAAIAGRVSHLGAR